MAVAVLVALIGSLAGLLASYHLGLAAGPAIVLSIGVLLPDLAARAGRAAVLTARLLARRHLSG